MKNRLMVFLIFLLAPAPAYLFSDSGDGRDPLSIDTYVLVKGPVYLKKARNLSGVTFNSDDQRLYFIQNRPARIIVTDLEGNIFQRIKLPGFRDTEDISYAGDGRFLLVEEGRSNVCLVNIDRYTESIHGRDVKKIALSSRSMRNTGIEGVDYSPRSGDILCVKEKNPKKIYRLNIKAFFDNQIIISNPWDLEKKPQGLLDVSGVNFVKDRYYILSHESSVLIETDGNGREYGKLNLKGIIKQAEGVSFDNSGRLYICGEPNSFYIFESVKK